MAFRADEVIRRWLLLLVPMRSFDELPGALADLGLIEEQRGAIHAD